MRAKLLLGLLAILLPTTARADLGTALGGFFIGKALDNFSQRLDVTVSRAMSDADYAVEKNGRTLQAIVDNARIQMAAVVDKKISELKPDYLNFLSKLDSVIDEVAASKGEMLRLIDFLALDTENIVRQMPGQKSFCRSSV